MQSSADARLRLTPARAAVLCAVATQRRPTLHSVAMAAGVAYGTARSCLDWLHDLGLVTWEPGTRGTLVARFRIERVPSGGGR